MTTIMNRLVTAPSALADRRGQPAERAHQLARTSCSTLDAALDRGRRSFAQASSRLTCDGDDVAQRRRLRRRAGCRRSQTVQTTKPTAARVTISEPPAAADRQHPAEQARAAVEHRGEHDAGEDQQQRLGEEDDRRGSARPRPIQTLARFSSWRITGSRSSVGPGCSLDVASGAPSAHRRVRRRRRLASGWSEVPARPPRSAVNQLIGFK